MLKHYALIWLAFLWVLRPLRGWLGVNFGGYKKRNQPTKCNSRFWISCAHFHLFFPSFLSSSTSQMVPNPSTPWREVLLKHGAPKGAVLVSLWLRVSSKPNSWALFGCFKLGFWSHYLVYMFHVNTWACMFERTSWEQEKP